MTWRILFSSASTTARRTGFGARSAAGMGAGAGAGADAAVALAVSAASRDAAAATRAERFEVPDAPPALFAAAPPRRAPAAAGTSLFGRRPRSRARVAPANEMAPVTGRRADAGSSSTSRSGVGSLGASVPPTSSGAITVTTREGLAAMASRAASRASGTRSTSASSSGLASSSRARARRSSTRPPMRMASFSMRSIACPTSSGVCSAPMR